MVVWDEFVLAICLPRIDHTARNTISPLTVGGDAVEEGEVLDSSCIDPDIAGVAFDRPFLGCVRAGLVVVDSL